MVIGWECGYAAVRYALHICGLALLTSKRWIRDYTYLLDTLAVLPALFLWLREIRRIGDGLRG